MSDILITTDELAARLGDASFALIDCRADLLDHGKGRLEYLEGHIQGAVFADLAHDLSGPPLSDCGRHPLPSAEALRALFGRLGIERGVRVIAYDASGGCFAARLWWLLRYMGHHDAALLDGGLPAWIEEQRPLTGGEEQRPATTFSGSPARDRLVLLPEVEKGGLTLIDARDPARYRGETEPLDPRPGHIPGAFNHFWRNNLDAKGRFLEPGALAAAFDADLPERPNQGTVFYCGSGVTACHNIFAAIRAGFPEPRLYAGSWSEWCSDPARPAEQSRG